MWDYRITMEYTCWMLVSTSKPGESLCGTITQGNGMLPNGSSQPPSLENPFVGHQLFCRVHTFCHGSQPPSLENPFVGYVKLSEEDQSIFVSTSKPGESLCGTSTVSLNYYRESAVSTSKPGESLCGTSAGSLKHLMRRLSQPPSLENPFVG